MRVKKRGEGSIRKRTLQTYIALVSSTSDLRRDVIALLNGLTLLRGDRLLVLVVLGCHRLEARSGLVDLSGEFSVRSLLEVCDHLQMRGDSGLLLMWKIVRATWRIHCGLE